MKLSAPSSHPYQRWVAQKVSEVPSSRGWAENAVIGSTAERQRASSTGHSCLYVLPVPRPQHPDEFANSISQGAGLSTFLYYYRPTDKGSLRREVQKNSTLHQSVNASGRATASSGLRSAATPQTAATAAAVIISAEPNR